jgi:hypothetical protein
MPEDSTALAAERFCAIDGAALPSNVRPLRPALAAAPRPVALPSYEALAAANAALRREAHALRWGLLLTRIFGVAPHCVATPSVAAQARKLATWIDAGCHGAPELTGYAEQQVRHIAPELRP